jgi:hypothetical protein
LCNEDGRYDIKNRNVFKVGKEIDRLGSEDKVKMDGMTEVWNLLLLAVEARA